MTLPFRSSYAAFALFVLLLCTSLHAQTGQADSQPSSPASSQQNSQPAGQQRSGSDSQKNSGNETVPTFSKKELTKRGFTFDDHKQPMCQISGPDGPCEVEAFVFGETNNDKSAHTCGKLDRSSYVGRCVQGKLEGLSVVLADGEKKQGKEGYISYFHEGRVAYPILTSYLEKDLNFGAREPHMSYGCVYFGKFDRREEKCKRFIQIYGPEIFTETNATALRNGTFDLAPYRANFVKFMQSKEEPAPLAPVPAILQRLRSH